ncbi:MAG: tetratricopeptide repeat protein [Ignavibacteria bacterium]|nr:tetratricopeptide repeat protein [Ignavibacteria bacterium]
MTYEELRDIISDSVNEANKGNYAATKESLLMVLAELEKIHPFAEVTEEIEYFNIYISLQFRANHLLARAEGRLGNNQQALDYATTSLMIAKEYLPDEVEGALNTMGIVCNYMNLYDKALEFYSQILDSLDNIKHDQLSAGTAVNIGLIYADIGSYTTALNYYEAALAVLEEIGDSEFRANVLGNIASIYSSLGSHEKALEYAYKALALKQQNENTDISTTLATIAKIYATTGEYTTALEFYQKALANAKVLGKKGDIAICLGSMGPIYQSNGLHAKAIEHLSEALMMFLELGNKHGVAVSKGYLGHTYSTINFEGYNAVKAEEYLLEAIDMCTEMGDKPNMSEVHSYLAELYKNEHRWQEALEHYQQHITIKDEVHSEEAKQQATLMEQRRQTAEREKEIALAKATAAAKLSATTNLLHKVLPESISTRMIEGEENIADFFPNVSILFADIAGFTPISADMPAYVVVRFLNHIFREFDRIMQKHGCEKIKTIGDGYMAIAGAPIECTDHAERITAAAFEMQETIQLPEEFGEYLPDGASFGIRIGLHTGSVVAGVIGDERFVWDVYSDAVNTAARMESHGEADKIHVTHDFVRLLQNRFAATKNTAHGIQFVKRGEMEIKGKGMMKTYYLQQAN